MYITRRTFLSYLLGAIGLPFLIQEADAQTAIDTNIVNYIQSQIKQVANNPLWYNVKGDGVTDDSAALQTVINMGLPVMLPKRKYLLNTGIKLPNTATLIFQKGACLMAGSAGMTVLTMDSYSQVEGLMIDAADPSIKGRYTGVQFIGQHSRLSNLMIFNPGTGLLFQGPGEYFNIVDNLYMYNANNYGINMLDSAKPANNNLFLIGAISGTKNNDSVGINIVGGNVNNFLNGEISYFNTPVCVDGIENRFIGQYLEMNNMGPTILRGINYFDVHCADLEWKLTSPNNAYTDAIGPALYRDIPFSIPSHYAMKSSYLFNDAAGSILHDSSGNNNHATIIGGKWTNGPGYGALQVNSANGDYIHLPKDVLDWSRPWTAGFLRQNLSGDSSSNCSALFVQDSNNHYIKINPTLGKSANSTVTFYDGANMYQTILDCGMNLPGKWIWTWFSYDPAAYTIYNPDSVRNSDLWSSRDTTKWANPLGNVTEVYAGKYLVGTPPVSNYAFIGLWQRVLGLNEVIRIQSSQYSLNPRSNGPEAYKVTSLPTAGPQYRGQIYRIDGAPGMADHAYMCTKNSSDQYTWIQIV